MIFFLTLKSLHIFAACMMLGSTLTNGILHSMAMKSMPSVSSVLLSAVMRINHTLMTPSFVLLPLTGAGLVYENNYSLIDSWVIISVTLTLVLIVAYIIGLRLETKLKTIAQNANTSLPPIYRQIFLCAAPIGAGATITSAIILWLMIAKPY